MPYSEAPNHFVHFHIPKTAGTTFRAQSSGFLKLFGVDQVVDNFDHFAGLAEAARRELPNVFGSDRAILSGHYRYRDIRPFLQGFPKPVGLTTFVRDPVKRIVSDYVYSSSEKHPGRESFISDYPTFEGYLEIEGQANKQVNYFCCTPNETLEETLQTLYSQFYFIGVSERYEADMTIFLKSLGFEFPQSRSENTSPDKQRALELIEEHRGQIEHFAAKDIELYRAIVQRTALPMNTVGSENEA